MTIAVDRRLRSKYLGSEIHFKRAFQTEIFHQKLFFNCVVTSADSDDDNNNVDNDDDDNNSVDDSDDDVDSDEQFFQSIKGRATQRTDKKTISRTNKKNERQTMLPSSLLSSQSSSAFSLSLSPSLSPSMLQMWSQLLLLENSAKDRNGVMTPSAGRMKAKQRSLIQVHRSHYLMRHQLERKVIETEQLG